MLIAAVQRLAAAGELPVRASFVVEGEEESGGTSASTTSPPTPSRRWRP